MEVEAGTLMAAMLDAVLTASRTWLTPCAQALPRVGPPQLPTTTVIEESTFRHPRCAWGTTLWS